jgi:uncharacterized MAPEG superfamily protein
VYPSNPKSVDYDCPVSTELELEIGQSDSRALSPSHSVGCDVCPTPLASHAASLQRGYVWTASSRDEHVAALTGVAGRLARALQNFVETFPLFAAGVLIAHVADTHNWMTEWVFSSFLGSRHLSRLVRSGGFSAAPSYGTWRRIAFLIRFQCTHDSIA